MPYGPRTEDSAADLDPVSGLRFDDSTELALGYVLRRRRMRRGNRVTLLRDGAQAFPAMLEAIAQAQRLILIEFYIWRADETGWRFAEALIERRRAGVEVRAIYDALGCMDVEPLLFEKLRENGIAVVEYRPLGPWRPRWGWLRRDHRKILAVDNRIGFCGGINLANDYASAEDGGGGWRDTAVRVEGPVVRDLSRLFLNTWERESKTLETRAAELRQPPPPVDLPRSPEVGREFVQVVSNAELLDRYFFKRSYVYAINRARKTIAIENPYFLPDGAIRRALIRAAKRGVHVRIIVPREGDVRVVAWATRYLFGGLLKHGIRIFEWRGAMIHAKTACIDGVWSTVGSYNIDHKSLRHNLEVNVNVLSRELGSAMDLAFAADAEQSDEVTLATVRSRGLWDRVRSWLLYQFRYFM